jgi:hypothetical protein
MAITARQEAAHEAAAAELRRTYPVKVCTASIDLTLPKPKERPGLGPTFVAILWTELSTSAPLDAKNGRGRKTPH